MVAAPALTVSVTAVGWAERAEELVGRDGAQRGDIVGVTGALGGAGAALAVLSGNAHGDPGNARAQLARARRPLPRLAAGARWPRRACTR